MKKGIVILLLLFTATASCQQKKLNVYVLLAEDCPICNYMGASLSAAASDHSKTISFFAVFPLKESSVATTNAFKKRHRMEQYKTVLDKKQMLAKKLGATVTPEVVITNSSDEILYRGRINDGYLSPGRRKHEAISNDLDNSIRKAIAGEFIPQPWKPAIGCYITFYN